MKYVLWFCCLVCYTNQSVAQSPLWQGHGRIVISADGNEHDHDDWAATPLSLAILASRGLQSHTPLYIYSDHIWGSNQEHPGVNGITPYMQMKESALKGGRMFRFRKTRFVCAVDDPEKAYEALKEQVNLSGENNPLFIIVAGPVQVIGEALSRSDSARRQYVTVISTDNSWNDDHADKPYGGWDQHSGWTMTKIRSAFATPAGGRLRVVSIPNQNPCLKRNWKEYEWLITSPERNSAYYRKGSWKWLFNRLCMTIKPMEDNGYYYAVDPSDAGKVIYLLTGVEKTSPQLCYELMRHPPQ